MKRTAIIVLFSLVLLNFFGLVNLKYLSYVIHIALVANFMWMAWVEKSVPRSFSLPFSLILIGFCCSMVSSVEFEHNNPLSLFRGGQFLLSIFYFFLLVRMRPEREDVERALVILSLLMCSFYILQFICMQFGVSLLPKVEASDEVDADLRMRMTGSALSAFGYFYGLCKLWNDGGKRLLNMALVILGATVILLMAFRTMIAGLAVVTVILAIKNSSTKSSLFRKVLLGAIVILVAINVPIVQRKMDYMIEKQMYGRETFGNKNYVRLLNLRYHYTSYFKNNVELFFGSGISGAKGSAYAKKLKMTDQRNFEWVDWGLLGLSWMVGIITVIGILLYVWRVLRIRYSPPDSYIFAFFLYLILVSITTLEFARKGNFAVQALALYLAYDIFCEQNGYHS